MTVKPKASTAKHTPRLVDPELKPAPTPDLLSAPKTSKGYATPGHSDKVRLAETGRTHKTDGRKQSIDKQIADLWAAIRKDQPYIANLIQRGKHEQAITRMRWQTDRHDRVCALSRKWEAIKAQAAIDKVQGPKPPVRIRTVKKRKHYPTWSNK